MLPVRTSFCRRFCPEPAATAKPAVFRGVSAEGPFLILFLSAWEGEDTEIHIGRDLGLIQTPQGIFTARRMLVEANAGDVQGRYNQASRLWKHSLVSLEVVQNSVSLRLGSACVCSSSAQGVQNGSTSGCHPCRRPLAASGRGCGTQNSQRSAGARAPNERIVKYTCRAVGPVSIRFSRQGNPGRLQGPVRPLLAFRPGSLGSCFLSRSRVGTCVRGCSFLAARIRRTVPSCAESTSEGVDAGRYLQGTLR